MPARALVARKTRRLATVVARVGDASIGETRRVFVFFYYYVEVAKRSRNSQGKKARCWSH